MHFRQTHNMLSIAIILITCLGMGFTQNNRQVDIQILDSATGQAVQPKSVSIVNIQTGKKALTLQNTALKQNGRIQLLLPEAEYQIRVTAEGYSSMSARISAGDEGISQVRLFLDPLNLPDKWQDEAIYANLNSDATLITGYVTDGASGMPLAGVKISASGTGISSTTDSDGYFQLHLPLSLPTGSLIFEKAGYSSQMRKNIELWPNGDWRYRIRLSPGNGQETVNDGISEKDETEDCESCEEESNVEPESASAIEKKLQQAALLPSVIRVGRNCPTKTTCSVVEIYSLQTYCKFVMPAEFWSCWGSLSGGANSLRAGAIAVRSYAVWHAYNPLTLSYDICSTSTCQNFGDVQSGNPNQAVDFTERFVLLNTSNDVARSEYSAENNDQGCGDGFTGTGTSWPCISDPVCSAQTPNGHGRGLCQWGSIRWANGTRILTSSPCAQGDSHGSGSKTWEEIIAHYYPDYTLVEGAAASIALFSVDPRAANQGQTVAMEYFVQAGPEMDVLLGASIRPSSGGDWIDDPANESPVSLNDGLNAVTRDFQIPANAPPGDYDVLISVRYDSDGSGSISSGDYIFDSQEVSNVLVLGVTGIERTDQPLPQKFSLSQNYPNPFNPETTIAFSLPQAAGISLKIYDSRGAEVAQLINGQLQAGSYEATWTAENFASGVYFYRLTAETGSGEAQRFEDTRRLILSK